MQKINYYTPIDLIINVINELAEGGKLFNLEISSR